MTTNLRLTDAGRDAILDAANIGVQAVQIVKLALGAGSGAGGADDDALTALRDQRDVEAVTGSAPVAGQIGLRAEFNSATAYPVTEIGLVARIGAGGAEFLFAYWTDGGTVFINKPADLRTIVAATVALVRSAADVTVTVAPDLTVSTVATLLDLVDAPDSYVNAAGHAVVVRSDGAGIGFAERLALAGLAEHTQANPPDDKAATPAGVRAVRDALLGGAPGALDTLNELAEALNDDANAYDTLLALINQRPTQADADARYARISAGTRMVFYQAAAPAGWTRKTDVDDRLLRVVANNGGVTGGQWEISGLSVGGHALTASEMPAHAHADGSYAASAVGGHTHTEIARGLGPGFTPTQGSGTGAGSAITHATGSAGGHGHNVSGTSGSTGGGQEHDHPIEHDATWRPAYASVIICQKD